MVTEMLRAECEKSGVQLAEAESTLLSLGIHADTGINGSGTQAKHEKTSFDKTKTNGPPRSFCL